MYNKKTALISDGIGSFGKEFVKKTLTKVVTLLFIY